MKLSILTLFALLTTINAEARDSVWLLCDNGNTAMNVFESRAHRPGASRLLRFTMIYGVHFLQGEMLDTTEGKITLIEAGAQGYKFDGKVNVDLMEGRNTLELNGELKQEDGTVFETVNNAFTCKTMNNN